MKSALQTIHHGTTALLAADVAMVSVDDLGPHILAIQSEMDRLRVVQCRLLTEADRHNIWKNSGHRSLEDWLAATGKTTKTAASRQKKLSDAIGKSKDLADARDAGNLFQAMYPPDGQTDTEREHAKRAKRSLRFTDQGDGKTRLDGQLTTADAATVQNALRAIVGKPTEGDDRTCEIDHIHEWDAQTGPTNLDLLVLWCVYHHHFRHRPDVTLHGDANNLTITLPDGRTMPLPARGPTNHTKPDQNQADQSGRDQPDQDQAA